MYRKAFRSSSLIAASLGLLVACNSGDVNIPGVEWPDNSSGPAGVIAFAEVSYSASEGEVINIRVSRSDGGSGRASVDYACVDGSAAAGSLPGWGRWSPAG